MKTFIIEKKDRFELSSTSKGNQRKWFSGNRYFKANMLGYEGFAEALASELLHFIKTDYKFADYFVCRIKEGDMIYSGCYSDNFLSGNQTIIYIGRLLKLCTGGTKRLASLYSKYKGKDFAKIVIGVVEKETGLNIKGYLDFMFKFDAIILNEDRHFNNISILRDDSDGTYELCPLFDNGLSLLSDITEYSVHIPVESLIRSVKSKPFISDFDKQAVMLSDEPLHLDYDGLMQSLEVNRGMYMYSLNNKRAVEVLKLRLNQTRGRVWV